MRAALLHMYLVTKTVPESYRKTFYRVTVTLWASSLGVKR